MMPLKTINMKRLQNKVAVVYGDGSVGSAIAKAFAGEGARIFLAGRTEAKLDAIAKGILSAGGYCETARVDALDEQAVEKCRDESAESYRVAAVRHEVGQDTGSILTRSI